LRSPLSDNTPWSGTAEPLPPELAAALSRVELGGLGTSFHFFRTIGSTNDVALTLAAQGDRDLAVVIADEQTAGRGRRGRTWFSPPGSGLYVSLILAPAAARADPERATLLLTMAMGLALAEAIERATALRSIDLKWPNDLYVAKRKLGGILAEAAATEPGNLMRIVLGYGINVGPMAYPPELGDRATSLETELGRAVDRAAVCAATLASAARRYRDLLDGRFDAILDAWRERAPGASGANVEWQSADGALSGVTAGVDDRGALLVRVGDRIERIVAGEVRWL
jgi:BirA family biotin operon repressor/biotin-[acetyl-CoA-carboxylase] ligase